MSKSPRLSLRALIRLVHHMFRRGSLVEKGIKQMTFNTAMLAALVITVYLGFIALAMISTSIS